METDPETVFDMPSGASVVADYLSPRGTKLDLLGISVMAQPPGCVDVSMKGMAPVLNVQLPGARREELDTLTVNGGKATLSGLKGGNFNLFAPLDSLDLRCTNYDWECLLEVNEDQLPELVAEAFDGRTTFRDALSGGFDPMLGQLGLFVVEHLRSNQNNRLYIEGLSIAMIARALALTTDKAASVATTGTDPRIARAIDYIEAHLGEDLSIARIAQAAAMSPSWFQSAFRSVTGRPVFAYVRERRLERARILLADPRLPLSQIAFACGFSSHSHMSRLFRARFGASPREMR